ncbi:MAG: AAA family ATPase [Phycisphaerae bacterium]|nr:AAA family ATPase [Phycisphaerae bacterium]
MYHEYFGLREEPFNITPDPRFLYLTAQHHEALNHVLYGIGQRKGFILLTGEVGTGKTTICRAVLRKLPSGFQSSLILNPALSKTELLRAIVAEFGFRPPGKHPGPGGRLEHLSLLNEHLLRVNCAGGEAVLIIDEAQDMSPEALEMVRLLSNLETERQKLLQIVLVGQPELRNMLARPQLRQLSQRITIRYHLTNMSRHETAGYLSHRLTIAGAHNAKTPVRFEPGAIREIFRHSHGTPRLINALGDKALLAGYVSRTSRINRKLVRRAARELKEACA